MKQKTKTTIFRIVMFILALFCLAMVIAAIDLNYADITAMFGIPLGVFVTLFIKSFGKKASDTDVQAQLSPVPATEVAPVPSMVSDEQVIPLAGGIPAPSAEKSIASHESHAYQLTKVLGRADDVFATLRSLSEHQLSSNDEPDKTLLATMVERSGLMDAKGLPEVGTGRLTRNEHFWIPVDASNNLDEDELRIYNLAITLEAALGLDNDLPSEVRTHAVTSPEAREAILRYMRSLVDLYGNGANIEHSDEEWGFRYTVANTMESLTTPFRVSYNLRANLPAHTCVMDVEIPREECFAFIASTPAERLAFARAYAYRLSMLAARVVLTTSERVERVVINAFERSSRPCLLSVDVTRDNLASLLKAARNKGLDEGGFPQVDAVTCKFDERGWFSAIEPSLALETECMVAPRKADYVHADTPVNEELSSLTGAKVYADFEIDENEPRVAAWEDLKGKLGESTTSAVSQLEQLRASAEDITVVEAASRTIDALVKGSVDVTDLDALHSTFVTGGDLDMALEKVRHMMDEDPDGDQSAIVTLLEPKVKPLLEFGAYLDDQTCVYRYFNNLTERIALNRMHTDGREVRCVPDAYFACLSYLSTALQRLGEYDKAERYTEEMYRIGPTCVDAGLAMVRLRENQSRIYDAVNVIKDMLKVALTARSCAILLYRLAYMEWKLGNEDVSVACYQRCMEWGTSVNEMAGPELRELLEGSDELEPLDDDEVIPALEKAGIPIGITRVTLDKMQRAAELACNSGFFYVTGVLSAVVIEVTHDDAVRGVLSSVARPH